MLTMFLGIIHVNNLPLFDDYKTLNLLGIKINF
jgi:hypothetical protein